MLVAVVHGGHGLQHLVAPVCPAARELLDALTGFDGVELNGQGVTPLEVAHILDQDAGGFDAIYLEPAP